MQTLNPNIEAASLSGLAVFVAARSADRPFLGSVAGLFSGMLFGVAHVFMAVLALPAMLLAQWMNAEGWRRSALSMTWFAGGLAVALLMWGALDAALPLPLPKTLQVCLGDKVLVDAKLPADVLKNMPSGGGTAGDEAGRQTGAGVGALGTGFNPCKEEWGGWHIHKLGPFTISIWGMLNWPFHDTLVRSGGVPFPFMFYIPLLFLSTLGALFMAAFLLGLVLSLADREKRRLSVPMLAYLLLIGAFLGVQENIGGYKFTFVAWLFLPVAFFASAGLSALFARLNLRVWAAYVLVVLGLLGVCHVARRSEFPLDERWSSQFRWKEVAQRIGETEQIQAAEKKEALTRFSLLPSAELSMTQATSTLPKDLDGGVLLEEFKGGIHVSNVKTWLTRHAIDPIPDGALVIVNSYIESAPQTLNDSRRCVVRAPAMKPDYTSRLDKVLSRFKPLPEEYYVVDSLVFPMIHLVPGVVMESPFYFNGYNMVYRVRRE